MGVVIRRMIDATEVAYIAAFLVSDKAWAVSGEGSVAVNVATGGAGRAMFRLTSPRVSPPLAPIVGA